MTEYIDTHAHIYENTEDDGLGNLYIKHVIMPSTDEMTFQNVIDYHNAHCDRTSCLIGMHPDYIKPDTYLNQIKNIENHLSRFKYVGIGEVGLDYTTSECPRETQMKFLEAIVELAKDSQMPMSLHIRDTFDDALQILSAHQNGNLRGCIHCFTGNFDQAHKFIDLGFYLGIGGIVTFKKSTLPQVLKDIPYNMLVVETDSPYLAPEPHRGKENNPGYLKYIVEKLSNIYEVQHEIIAATTTANACKVFNL